MVKQFKFLVMAGLLLVVIVACQRDETLLQDEKGISLEEARQFFEKQETEKEKNGIDFKITPKWETFKESGENKDFVYVQAIINHQKERKAEIFFAKTKNGLKGTVIAEHYVNDNLVFLISDLEGNILSITHFGREKTSASQSGRIPFWMCREGEGPCLNCYKCMELEPVPGVPGALRYPLTDPVGLCWICRLSTIHLEPVDVYGTKPKSVWNDPWNDPRIPPMRDFDEINKRFEQQRQYYGIGVGGGYGGGYAPPATPDHIIDEITDETIRCLHDKLRNGNNDYVKEIFSKFEGNDTEFDIVISSENKVFYQGREVNAKTTFTRGSKAIHIRISESKAVGRSALEIARTIFHEYIHADIHRKLKTQDYENTPEIKSFRETYSNYMEMLAKKNNIKEVPDERRHHEYMAKYYVSVMRDALKKFHREQLTADYNKYVKHYEKEPSDELYEALAWQGLNTAGIKAYEEEDADKKRRMNNLLETEVGMLTKNCEENGKR